MGAKRLSAGISAGGIRGKKKDANTSVELQDVKKPCTNSDELGRRTVQEDFSGVSKV